MATLREPASWLGRYGTLLSSLSFLGGSILFLPAFADHSEAGVWCFIAGSLFMLGTTLLQILTATPGLAKQL